MLGDQSEVTIAAGFDAPLLVVSTILFMNNSDRSIVRFALLHIEHLLRVTGRRNVIPALLTLNWHELPLLVWTATPRLKFRADGARGGSVLGRS